MYKYISNLHSLGEIAIGGIARNVLGAGNNRKNNNVT